MDSREVNRVLKRVVWDELKGHGFVERTGRTAWRRRERTIDVVNFQSFNAYLAEQICRDDLFVQRPPWRRVPGRSG